MRKSAFLTVLIVFIFFGPLCLAQKKVKYKDIFGLLTVKQYEQAEPFLKQYLKENDDNPSAFLYMGTIYQEKSGKDDILKQTRLAIARMDSAIIFYNKAYQTITEKEIKRNSEYYQIYNRRDLRTGEFGVKLSDIQFDLEKKMEGLRERIDRVKMVKHYFSLSDTLYKRSAALYSSITSTFANERELYLRSDESTLKSLGVLASRFDSCTKAFDQYKSSLSTLGKTGYSPSLNKNEIKDFKKEGLEAADFYKDDVNIWDYKAFSQKVKTAIETDLIPLREHLISYDVELNKLREKLSSDSVSVRNDLTKLIDKLLLGQLRKYDPDPLPMDVFSIKIADLEYKSILLENKPLRDSANFHFQVDLTRRALNSAQKLDSLAGRMLNRDLDYEMKNYSHYVDNTYGNGIVLKSFIRVVKEFAEREKGLRSQELAVKQNALRWMVLGADSIPLFLDGIAKRFRPLIMVPDQYTAGVKLADSVKAEGYFYSITPSRVPDIKISFPVENVLLRKSAQHTHGLTYSDAAGQLFFVVLFSDAPLQDNKYSATVAKIYRSDGLAWSSNYKLPFVPKEILFRNDTGEFVMKADAQESVVDRNGKLLR